MVYLIGGNGFVGSAFTRLFDRLGVEYRIIGRDDYERLSGTSCDILINANGNSKKFLADLQPIKEFEASVKSVLQSLTTFTFGYYVHLSSGDVYPDQSYPDITHEDMKIPVERLSRYGCHKYLAEQLVRHYAQKWLIIRMGGFVGPHLKKNAIFDLTTGSPVWLTPDSELQYIRTDSAAEIIWQLIDRDVGCEIINLGAKGTVQIGQLHQEICSSSLFHSEARKIRFELNLEKLQALLGQNLPSTHDEISKFLSDYQQLNREKKIE